MNTIFTKYCWSCNQSYGIDNYKKRKSKFRKYCNTCYNKFTKEERNNNVKNIIINMLKER